MMPTTSGASNSINTTLNSEEIMRRSRQEELIGLQRCTGYRPGYVPLERHGQNQTNVAQTKFREEGSAPELGQAHEFQTTRSLETRIDRAPDEYRDEAPTEISLSVVRQKRRPYIAFEC